MKYINCLLLFLCCEGFIQAAQVRETQAVAAPTNLNVHAMPFSLSPSIPSSRSAFSPYQSPRPSPECKENNIQLQQIYISLQNINGRITNIERMITLLLAQQPERKAGQPNPNPRNERRRLARQKARRVRAELKGNGNHA